MTSADESAKPARLALIDAARGVALVAMVIYHFSWDLTTFGYADFDLFGDPWWLAFRTAILSAFLIITGLSQQLSHADGLVWRRDVWRLAKIVAAAAAITLVTWEMFPGSYIFFGVLHHIAVASLILSLLYRLPWWAMLVLAVLAAVLPVVVPPNSIMDAPAALWIGLASYEPISNDFVPMLPWLALILAGAAGATLLRHLPSRAAPVLGWSGQGAIGRSVRFVGRHTLLIYLVHQPILWGALTLWARIAAA